MLLGSSINFFSEAIKVSFRRKYFKKNTFDKIHLEALFKSLVKH